MATKYNIEGKIPSNYPGVFNARENKLISSNYSAIVGADEENVSLAAGDGITHVVVNCTTSSVEVVLPKAELSKGRLVSIKVDGASGVDVKEEGELAFLSGLAEGSYQVLCT